MSAFACSICVHGKGGHCDECDGKRKGQPRPKKNQHRPVWDQVIADMKARDRTGRERYGTPLQPFNGRDALLDAYEEALDLAVYLKQALIERDAKGKP